MGHDALPNLAAFVLQVCVIAGVAAIVSGALRIASAGTRYLCWRLVLVVCLAMPVVLQRTVPTTTPGAALAPVATDAVTQDLAGFEAPASPLPSAPAPQSMPWGTVAMLIVAAGVVGRGAWLAIGLVRLRALRRHGELADDKDYDEIQRTLGTRATLLSVAGLSQPATFGLWRPVVLLPETLGELPPALRRAVVTHELFHVQRHDWLWVLTEELVRSLVWFHPAILWLTSRVQLAREELVDELTVLATGNRKVYIEALLAFADAGCVRPAPAFARRRHLFTRLLKLSKERAMSSPRIVVSAAVMIVAVVAAGWYASSVFPILSAAPAQAASPSSSPRPQPSGILPRYQVDRLRAYFAGQSGPAAAVPSRQSLEAPAGVPQGARSGGAARPGPAPVPTAPAQTVANGNQVTPENPIPRRIYSVPVPYPQELQGSLVSAAVEVRVLVDMNGATTVLPGRFAIAASSADPGWTAANANAASGANDGRPDAERLRALQPLIAAQQGQRDAFRNAVVQSVIQWRYDSPAQAPVEFSVAVTFAPGQEGVVTQSAESRGVSAGGGRVNVGTFNTNGNPLDPAGRLPNAQLAELDRQQLDLTKRRGDLLRRLNPQHPDVVAIDTQLRALTATRAALLAELLKVSTASSLSELQTVTAAASRDGASTAPIRVGGNIRPPMKTKHVNPAYPADAQAQGIQGVVIMEITIDETGHVSDARVLRSIPALDDAAAAAVRQWEFQPTLLNGKAVPILMTVTVQFSLN